MALSNLSQLYREVILDHAQHPRNHKQMNDATHYFEMLNPTCGDAVVVQAKIENNRIVDVAYTGYGCSISMASASMMSEVLKGKEIETAIKLVEMFNQLVKGERVEEKWADELKDAFFLEGVKQFPARYKCAVLAWKALEGAVSPKESE